MTDANLSTVATRGKTRLVAELDGVAYDVGDRGWQRVVNQEHLTRISSQLRRGGWAVRQLPGLTHIEVDPELLSGRPAIRGHRLSAQEVAETAEEPNGVETLIEGYGLRTEEISDARDRWREVRRLAA